MMKVVSQLWELLQKGWQEPEMEAAVRITLIALPAALVVALIIDTIRDGKAERRRQERLENYNQYESHSDETQSI